jgi:hypothetical protein
MKGIQICSNEGPSPLQRGIITKVQKYGGVLCSHEPQDQKSSDLYESFLTCVQSILSIHGPWDYKGHKRVKHIYICFNKKSFGKSLQKTTDPKNFKFTQGDLMQNQVVKVMVLERLEAK